MKNLLFILVFVSMLFADNLPQRGVNRRVEFISATGEGTDSLPYITTVRVTDTVFVFAVDTTPVSIMSPVDQLLKSIIAIDPAHHEIHEGMHFYVKGYISLANQDSLLILFIVQDIPAHALFQIAPQDGEGFVTLYEGSTASDSGDACISFNRNRGSSNAATVLCFTDPTITDYGTRIYLSGVGSGKAFGGEVRGSNEIIGDTFTTYLLVLDNNTTSANLFDYLMDWYEHLPDSLSP